MSPENPWCVKYLSHQKYRHQELKNQLNIQHDIVDRIQSRRLRYFNHVVRMQPSRWPHQALYGRVHGNRHRGRPRKRWTDNISDDCQMMGLSLTQPTHGLRTEGNRRNTRGCLSILNCIAMHDTGGGGLLKIIG